MPAGRTLAIGASAVAAKLLRAMAYTIVDNPINVVSDHPILGNIS